MTHAEFKERFIPLQKMLYREAYRTLGDAFEAEDAVQNLYVKLWEQKERLGHLVTPEAYCKRILRNICIDRWRAIRAHAEEVVDADEMMAVNAPPDIEQDEAKEFIAHYLATLSAQQRLVMTMQMGGDSFEEIAEATGLTVGNVKVIISRTRKRFKEIYYK